MRRLDPDFVLLFILLAVAAGIAVLPILAFFVKPEALMALTGLYGVVITTLWRVIERRNKSNGE